MIIEKKFFPKIIKDNDENYFAHFYGILSSVDELCSVTITKKSDGYNFRIATSLPKYNNLLIEEIIKFHSLLRIKLEFSKSIKTTGTIAFSINL